MAKLNIDQDLRALVHPVSEDTWNLMQLEIKGTEAPVSVTIWASTVLVDYEKYEIAQMENRKIVTETMNFSTKDEAIIWICRNQLQRTDLCENMRRYLIGRLYLASNKFCSRKTKNLQGMHYNGKEYAVDLVNRMAEEFHYSPTYIRCIGRYARILDDIHEYFPVFRDYLLSGKIEFSMDNLSDLQRYDKTRIIRICQKIISNPKRRYRDILREVNAEEQEEAMKIMNQKTSSAKSQASGMTAVTVKDMPAYDPDAAISSLALTVPSWGSSIQRVKNTTNLDRSSKEAKQRLRRNLISLGAVIFDMLVVLEVEM